MYNYKTAYTDSNKKLVGKRTLVQLRMKNEHESMKRTRLMNSRVLGGNDYIC